MSRKRPLGEIPGTQWRSRTVARRNAPQLRQKGQNYFLRSSCVLLETVGRISHCLVSSRESLGELDVVQWIDIVWAVAVHQAFGHLFQNKLMCAENEYRLPLHLMCSTTLLIVDKFTIYKVSTSTRAERQPFLNNYNIASEKAIFIDFTSYYYPGKCSLSICGTAFEVINR